MIAQEKTADERRNADRPASEAMSHGLNHFAADITSLVELQGELFQSELTEWATHAASSFRNLAFGLVLACSAAPFLLGALAVLLHDEAELSWPASLALVGVGGLALAAVLVGAAWQRLSRDAPRFERCRGELKNNLRWLSGVLGPKSNKNRCS